MACLSQGLTASTALMTAFWLCLNVRLPNTLRLAKSISFRADSSAVAGASTLQGATAGAGRSGEIRSTVSAAATR